MLRKFGAAACPQIAGHADFNRKLALGQFFDQFRILRGSQAVTDAFRFEIQRAPDGFGPCTLARVRREMKTVLRAERIGACEPLWRTGTLVAANAEGNHVAIMKLDREVEHPLRFLGAELANRIEYPQQRNAEVFLSALAATFQALENRGEVLLAPEANTDRNNDLRMQNVLRFQPLHQPVGDQLVVFRRAQMSRHVFESRQETREVCVVVKLLPFGERRTLHRMTLPQFEQRGRLDGALEMQMELGLWECADEAGGLRRHATILKDESRVLAGFAPPERGRAQAPHKHGSEEQLKVNPVTRSPDVFPAELAMMTAVENVNQQPQRQPDHESKPGDEGEPRSEERR